MLASLTGKTVRNEGIRGETAQTIAARMGAAKINLSGPFNLAAKGGSSAYIYGDNIKDEYGADVAPRELTESWTNVLIGGVRGKLSGLTNTNDNPRRLNSALFTRTLSGEVINLTSAESMEITTGASFVRGDINVIFVGQNGWDDGSGYCRGNGTAESENIDGLINIIDRMIANTGDPNKCIIVGRMSGNASANLANYTDAESAMAAKYGDRFMNMREYLSNETNLAKVGITATETDKENIASGSLPQSLWASASGTIDKVHLNANGYRLFAQGIYEKLIALNLINN